MLKKLYNSRIARAITALYALDILELLLLTVIVITDPRWLLPIAILTQTGQLIAGMAVAWLVWKSGSKKLLERWRRYRSPKESNR